MATISVLRFVRLGVVLLVCVPLPSSAEPVASHCAAREQTWFTCRARAKVASVCAVRGASGDVLSVQYRFGSPGPPEIAHPPVGGNWRALTRGGVLTLAGGGGAYLAFTRGPYRYVVYTAIGGQWGEKAGVAVERNGKRVANVPCTGQETSELGPDLFGQVGIADDTAGFDLP